MRFHREVVVPDFRDALETRIGAAEEKLHNEAITIADGIYKRFDRVESEIVSLGAGVTRLEERITVVEQRMRSIEEKLDQVAIRSELVELEERVDEMQQRIAELKST